MKFSCHQVVTVQGMQTELTRRCPDLVLDQRPGSIKRKEEREGKEETLRSGSLRIEKEHNMRVVWGIGRKA